MGAKLTAGQLRNHGYSTSTSNDNLFVLADSSETMNNIHIPSEIFSYFHFTFKPAAPIITDSVLWTFLIK